MDDFNKNKNYQSANDDNLKNTDKARNDVNNAKQTLDLAAIISKAISGKSEGQIFNAIIAQAEQGKREGTLTNAELDNFYNTVAPLLDSFRRKKLAQVIEKLKEI